MIKSRVAALSTFCMLALSSAARSQPMITLEGVVRDAHSGLARAQVTAFDSLTNQRRIVMTNDRGYFRILGLAPGRYAISARSIGRAVVTQALELFAGQRAEMDFKLESAASVLETVMIEATTPNASIQRMSVSNVVTAREIQHLPLNTRNVMELAGLAPGIRSFQPVEGRSLPSAGSLRDERAINMYLDGVEMKNFNSTNVVGSPQTGSPLPADALEEMRVSLNPYDAEFARGAAYVLSAVSRRGTNEKHGSAFAFFQNKDLISVTNFQRQIPNFAKPDFSRRQVGFGMSGPVVRDRFFYAASYENANTDTYIAVVPGKPAGDPSFWDDYAGVFKAPNDNHTGLLRLTYAANPANAFDAIWSSRYMTGESRFGGTETHESAVDQKYSVNTLNLRHTWIPNSRVANELSFQFVGWSHENGQIEAGPELKYPTLTIGRADAIFEIHETQFRAIERLTYGIGTGPGSHLLKGGLEVSRLYAQQYSPNGGGGSFRFRGETEQPYEAVISVGFLNPESTRDADTSLSGWVLGGYLNDEWHVTPRIVVNVGLRYDVETNTLNNDIVLPWVSDPTLASLPEVNALLNRGHRENDLDNLSPRFSFSWDVTGNRRTYVRGGYGVMYDRIPGFVVFGERRSATWRTYTFSNPGTVDPDELRNRVISGGGTALPPAVTLVPRKMDVPENRQWSLGVGAQITRSLSVNLDYIDQSVRNLFAPVNLNWLDASRSPAQRVLSSAYGNIIAWTDRARGKYQALLTSVAFAPDTILRLNLSHTLGSAKADWDVENSQVPASAANQFYVMQRISGDERHRFVLSGMVSLPFGVGISTIATAASPRPYRIIDGRDVNRNNLQDDDWVNGKRYAVPADRWKNWYRVVDLRLSKVIAVGRDTHLSLLLDAFNVFNTENYSGYFGVQRTATGAFRPDFGSPSGTFATRQFQLGSKIQF